MSGEIRLRHIFPSLSCSGFFDENDINALDVATPPLQCGRSIGNPRDGYVQRLQKRNEFPSGSICLSSASLLQQGCNVESLVRYIGGTHTGAHRNIAEIRRRLTPSVDPELLHRIIEIFEYGAPRGASGYL